MNYAIISGVILAVILLSLFMRQRALYKKLKQLRNNWGKIPHFTLDIESARIFSKLHIPSYTEHGYRVDEDTWSDLDCDEIFALINRTTTPTGAQYLFSLLKHPVLKKDILDDREKLIDRFSNDQKLREKVQLAIQSLEDTNARYLPHSLWEPLPERPSYAKYLPILSSISILFLLLVIFNVLHFGVLIGVFFVNFFIRLFVKRRIDVLIYSFQYLGVLISAAKKLSSLNIDETGVIQQALKKNLEKTKIIGKKIFALQCEDSFGLMEYVNIYFLWDIAGYYSAINGVRQHIEELRNLYEMVGYLDAMISIASFRLDYDQHCRPSFSTNYEQYKVDGIYNPLLTDPVSNSFEFATMNFLVTGSNMAGKTTFLRTMGVNAILSQTINTCMAGKYEAPFIRVMSSIGREDNLLLGKSYYMAEVESIHRLIKASESDSVHLLILDEIFRGTNSVERHAASIEVLKYLTNEKDFVLVATHDLELSEALAHEYQNIHFQEDVCDDGLSFDYKLHPGSSTTRNAIAFLRHVGYPKSIIDNATNRIIDGET